LRFQKVTTVRFHGEFLGGLSVGSGQNLAFGHLAEGGSPRLVAGVKGVAAGGRRGIRPRVLVHQRGIENAGQQGDGGKGLGRRGVGGVFQDQDNAAITGIEGNVHALQGRQLCQHLGELSGHHPQDGSENTHASLDEKGLHKFSAKPFLWA